MGLLLLCVANMKTCPSLPLAVIYGAGKTASLRLPQSSERTTVKSLRNYKYNSRDRRLENILADLKDSIFKSVLVEFYVNLTLTRLRMIRSGLVKTYLNMSPKPFSMPFLAFILSFSLSRSFFFSLPALPFPLSILSPFSWFPFMCLSRECEG